MPDAPRPERFGRAFRLGGRRAFQRVFAARVRRESGPFLLYGAPNDVGHPRLGLSVGKRVGNAVERHRAKRLVREAFRRLKAEQSPALDVVVVVRPGRPLEFESARRHLERALALLVRAWEKRGTDAAPTDAAS